MNKELFDLADRYEGNLLNYFCGMTPQESRKFNKMVKETKRKKRWKLHLKIQKRKSLKLIKEIKVFEKKETYLFTFQLYYSHLIVYSRNYYNNVKIGWNVTFMYYNSSIRQIILLSLLWLNLVLMSNQKYMMTLLVMWWYMSHSTTMLLSWQTSLNMKWWQLNVSYQTWRLHNDTFTWIR